MSHRPRKRFGQNFLHDPAIIDRIVATIAPAPGERLVEIGPGRGALTRPLLACGAVLDVIEIDRDLAAALAVQFEAAPLTVHQADALRFDFATLGAGPLRLVGNLPYNISTPLLFHVLAASERFADIHVMLQKEVVDRMAAGPGSRTYGRLSVALAARCRVEALFTIRAGAFTPRPRVESAFARLVPEPERAARVRSFAAFDALLARAFSMRRKQLARGLEGWLTAAEIAALGIDPGCRPETLGAGAFVDLANAWAARAGVESRADRHD